MKKIILLVIISAGLIFQVNAQSVRMVLIEEATNASCNPCASQNPAFDILLNANRDVLTVIKYHWYFPGYDPMHDHNPGENDGRVSYYGINGVPTATIDGVIPNGPTFDYPGGPHGYTQALIDTYAAVLSPFEISLSHHLSADNDSIYIEMMIQATQNVTGNLIAHMVVVEKHVHFSSPPGANSEKDFQDVMKKMIPGLGGTPIGSSFQAGDYLILQGSWKLQNIYNLNEIGVVGFIQNNTNKHIQQAGNSTTDPLAPLYNNESNITKITQIPETNCLGVISPKITIRNNGAYPLTSIDIKYHVNGENIQTYTWAGNLEFLESEEVTLPDLSFTIEDENKVVVYTENPNSSPDEYPKNDTIVQPFERAAVTPTTVKLMLRTDNNPQQTTWEVKNSAGVTVFSGGPYPNPTTLYQETMVFTEQDCYEFFIYDTGGDGLTIPGFYSLYYNNSITISSGTTFGPIDSAFFEVNTGVGIHEKNASTDVLLFPNPAKSLVNISFFLYKPEHVAIMVYSSTGTNVLAKDEGIVEAGPANLSIMTDNLRPGFYIVKVNIGEETITRRLTVL